ncbi:MAG: ferritin-like protein, partial [Bacteroidia bacterium]|nr:ferritin-like protein [Bacteroidia bacterium]
MSKKSNPVEIFKDLGIELSDLKSPLTDTDVQELVNELYGYLKEASELEHLLAMQYLYAAFSLKKYPEEFDDYPNADPKINEKRIAQLEVIRRWEAEILYVSRQEMEHLNLVQNLMVILGMPPYLFRPNFPVPATNSVVGKPINLMPFDQHAIEIFRYWEKPDSIVLPDPFGSEDIPGAIRKMAAAIAHPTEAVKHDQDETRKEAWQRVIAIVSGNASAPVQFKSIEELYEYIWLFFAVLFELRLIDGKNLMKVSEEHFGFNITLDTIVDGKYFEYVDTVITRIVSEGEGVWGVPPPLDSHFTVYQKILDGILLEKQNAAPATFSPALPVVWNPGTTQNQDLHQVPLAQGAYDPDVHPITPITNTVTIDAIKLFNMGYDVLIKMLNGYFADYSIDQTTGIRPKEINAFFRTSFYPFMTMIFRPLGEIICRLPVDDNYLPVPGKVPPQTAGPNFLFELAQSASTAEKLAHTAVLDDSHAFVTIFQNMADLAGKLKK